MSAGTGGALLVDKPALSGYTFGLGAEVMITQAWSIQAEGLLLVGDNLKGAPENKSFGFYTGLKYRAFLSDMFYMYGMFGPGYAEHRFLVKGEMQFLSEVGIGTTGFDGWGLTLGWRHMSNGQVGNGNLGVDYISVAIRYEWMFTREER